MCGLFNFDRPRIVEVSKTPVAVSIVILFTLEVYETRLSVLECIVGISETHLAVSIGKFSGSKRDFYFRYWNI